MSCRDCEHHLIKSGLKNINLFSAGHRVKSARMLGGYSRTAFAKISNISAATLRAWEEPNEGRYGLTQKGAERLIDALSRCNVHCSVDWLLYGKGFGPSIAGQKTKLHNLDFEQITWGAEESILKDIAAFKTNNPNAIVTMISDETMSPFFSNGDYVGGCLESDLDIKKLSGTNCIIDTGSDLLVRKIIACHKNLYTVTSVNPSLSEPLILSVQIKSAAEIVWHRRRKKS